MVCFGKWQNFENAETKMIKKNKQTTFQGFYESDSNDLSLFLGKVLKLNGLFIVKVDVDIIEQESLESLLLCRLHPPLNTC